MKNHSHGLAALPLVIIVVIALGLGGYFAYRSTQPNYSYEPSASPPLAPVSPTTPPPSPTPASSPVPDETANWKTYRNDEYGFEFRYPPNVKVGSVATGSVLNQGDDKVGGIYLGRVVFTVVELPAIRQRADEYIKKYEEIARNKPAPSPPEGPPSLSCESELLNNNGRYVHCGRGATYALIESQNFDVFVDRYSQGWYYSSSSPSTDPFYTDPSPSSEELKSIISTFRFTK